ncbi:GNAT family N-acetyltransferase [Humidisolicoccus flavus]|uniref:GNAT family N-acetyltransferase n=1 Tax=Humidisolicoccus flavus TaxID=3111414 RepID=UPI003245AC35
MFTDRVFESWMPAARVPDEEAAPASRLRVVIDDTLPANRALMILTPDRGEGLLTVTSAIASTVGLVSDERLDPESVQTRLATAGIALNGADHLFYLPAHEQERVATEQSEQAVQSEQAELSELSERPDRRAHSGRNTRQLGAEDAAAFAAFVAAAPEDDLDEAFVELDHWLVFGTFVEGAIVTVSSMYPWQSSALADLGVITLPEFRGQGHARTTVRAISARAIALGYEPQYRCQLDNAGSVALAHSAGFERFATWDVIDPGD